MFSLENKPFPLIVKQMTAFKKLWCGHPISGMFSNRCFSWFPPGSVRAVWLKAMQPRWGSLRAAVAGSSGQSKPQLFGASSLVAGEAWHHAYLRPSPLQTPAETWTRPRSSNRICVLQRACTVRFDAAFSVYSDTGPVCAAGKGWEDVGGEEWRWTVPCLWSGTTVIEPSRCNLCFLMWSLMLGCLHGSREDADFLPRAEGSRGKALRRFALIHTRCCQQLGWSDSAQQHAFLWPTWLLKSNLYISTQSLHVTKSFLMMRSAKAFF